MESPTFQLCPVPSVVRRDTHGFPDIFGNVATENLVQSLCAGNGDIVGCQMPWGERRKQHAEKFTLEKKTHTIPNSYNHKRLTGSTTYRSTLSHPSFTQQPLRLPQAPVCSRARVLPPGAAQRSRTKSSGCTLRAKTGRRDAASIR